MKAFRWNNLVNRVMPLQSHQSNLLGNAAVIPPAFLQVENFKDHSITEELKAAREEIISENIANGIMAAELVVANEELVIQSQEHKRVTNELILVQNDLDKAKLVIEAHVEGLEEIMFITSHKVRQPLANILGLSSILDQFLKAPATMKKMVGYIRESSLSLDGFTKDLTGLVKTLKKKSHL